MLAARLKARLYSELRFLCLKRGSSAEQDRGYRTATRSRARPKGH